MQKVIFFARIFDHSLNESKPYGQLGQMPDWQLCCLIDRTKVQIL